MMRSVPRPVIFALVAVIGFTVGMKLQPLIEQPAQAVQVSGKHKSAGKISPAKGAAAPVASAKLGSSAAPEPSSSTSDPVYVPSTSAPPQPEPAPEPQASDPAPSASAGAASATDSSSEDGAAPDAAATASADKASERGRDVDMTEDVNDGSGITFSSSPDPQDSGMAADPADANVPSDASAAP